MRRGRFDGIEKKLRDSEQLYSRMYEPIGRNSQKNSRPKTRKSVTVAARPTYSLLRPRPGVAETPGRPASDIDVKVISRYVKVKSGRVQTNFSSDLSQKQRTTELWA